jgi:hypothetical protein
MDHHIVAAVSISGISLDVLGGLYLAYDLLGGQHGPLRLLTRIVTYSPAKPSSLSPGKLRCNAFGSVPRAATSTRFLFKPLLEGDLHQHHQIEVSVFVPSAQPADLPIVESRTQFHWMPKAKIFHSSLFLQNK